MPPSPSPPRRKPHCHKCGLAMAGHRRPDGAPVCPDTQATCPGPSPITPTSSDSTNGSSFFYGSSLSSPPPTPPPRTLTPPTSRESSPTPDFAPAPASVIAPPETPKLQAHHNVVTRIPSLEALQMATWQHRRNPNWTQPPPPILPRSQIPDDSDAATDLVDDDGRTIRGSHSDLHHDDNDNDSDDGASVSSGFFEQLGENFRGSRRVVAMFATKRTNVGRSQQLAAKQGMHAALVRFPGPGPVGSKSARMGSSWWMAVGRDSRAVYSVISTAESQRRMPGVMEDLTMEGPRLTTFLHTVLAAVIASILVVCGLARI